MKEKVGFSDLDAAMENVIVTNLLECKVSCSMSKVLYVFDIEDVLCCVKKKVKMNGKVLVKCKLLFEKNEKVRFVKFYAWVEEKVKEVEDVMDIDEKV